MTATDSPERLAKLERLARADPHSAILWFRLAQERESAGERDAAREAYIRARDLDGMPWRAPTGSNDAIRAVAHEEGIPLIDCEAAFQRATAKAAPGWDFFDDHVHPSIRGRTLYARTIVAELLPVLGLREGAALLQDDTTYNRRLGGDNLLCTRQAYGAARSVFRDSPLVANNEQVYGRFTELMDELDGLMSPPESAAWHVYQRLLAEGAPSPPIGLIAGTMLMQEGRLREAIYQLGIARRACPSISLSFVQSSWTEGHCRRILGEPLGEPLERDLDWSLMALDVLPQIDKGPPYPLLKARGNILWVLEEREKALAELEKALAVANDDERRETQQAIDAIRAELQPQSTRLNIE